MLLELISEDKRRIFELEQQIVQIERTNDSKLLSDVYLGLSEMANRIENLENMANQEPRARRQDMRRRVAHLKGSHIHIQSSLGVLANRIRSSKYETQRNELFGDSHNDGNNDNHLLDLEAAVSESTSLDRSQGMVQSYLSIGRETLEDLYSQKERLKGVQRKALDILNYLGLSQSIMKNVENRENIDKWITYIGMFTITCILVSILYYR